MKYKNTKEWLLSKNKAVTFFGMSGVGKSYLSSFISKKSDWFHYSVDYRIGADYLSKKITEISNTEKFLKPKRKDDTKETSNLTIHNISLLSKYLGKPGNSIKGGIPFYEYKKRQKNHKEAEIKATFDAKNLFEKVLDLGKHKNFICDTSGSLCEIVNADNPNDKILKNLSNFSLLVWIKGSDKMTEKLVERFCNSPKPMYYNEDFLNRKWKEYLSINDVKEENVDPNDFIIFGFKSLIKHRLPIYKKISEKWGIKVDSEDIKNIKDESDFVDLISSKLEQK